MRAAPAATVMLILRNMRDTASCNTPKFSVAACTLPHGAPFGNRPATTQRPRPERMATLNTKTQPPRTSTKTCPVDTACPTPLAFPSPDHTHNFRSTKTRAPLSPQLQETAPRSPVALIAHSPAFFHTVPATRGGHPPRTASRAALPASPARMSRCLPVLFCIHPSTAAVSCLTACPGAG